MSKINGEIDPNEPKIWKVSKKKNKQANNSELVTVYLLRTPRTYYWIPNNRVGSSLLELVGLYLLSLFFRVFLTSQCQKK